MFNWTPLLKEKRVDVVKCMQPAIPMWVKLKALYEANAMSLNVHIQTMKQQSCVKICIINQKY